LAQNQDNVSE